VTRRKSGKRNSDRRAYFCPGCEQLPDAVVDMLANREPTDDEAESITRRALEIGKQIQQKNLLKLERQFLSCSPGKKLRRG
jgi:hypothetical protein